VLADVADVLFIPWRVGAERRAGSCPSWEATAPPIPFWCYRVVAGAAEPGGWLRRRRACNILVRTLAALAALDPPSASHF
jgi:hypothetical protein